MQINKTELQFIFNNFLLIFSLPLLLLINLSAKSQTTDNGAIDFDVVDEKISSALYRLGNQSQLNFTYDAGDSLFKRKINYQAKNKHPLLILDELLSNTNHSFKQIGNQVVIYKDKSKISASTTNKNTVMPVVAVVENPISSKPHGIIKSSNIIRDTVFVTDTIYKYQYDTLLINDTVFVEKIVENDNLVEPDNQVPKYFNSISAREKGWTTAINIAPIVADFSLSGENNDISVRNFSLGVEISKNFKKWNVSGGLKLTHFGEKFNQTYNISEGGYFIADTVDEYYTIIQTDTSWYYVTDSTWSPVDNHEYSYNINNRVAYLEFFAALSFDYFSNRKYSLYAKAGLQTGIMIYKKGIAIQDANEPEGIDFADLNFNTASYSFSIGTGINYRISDHFDFNSELYYFRNISDIIDNYPIDKRLSGLGLKLGLVYYF